jgi:glyceraldehyde 3-phosphate dehydrogenase
MNIGINGFGRIGRLALRAALLNYPDVTVTAVNTSGSMDMHDWAILFKYDTVYGTFPKNISTNIPKSPKDPKSPIGTLTIDSHEIPFYAERNPEDIPWGTHNADIILESTGVFRTKETAEKHLAGGAKKVIISAPPKDDTPLCMLRINEENGNGHDVISNCSCTTYSSAPVMQTIVDHFGFVHGSLTTIHAYTSDQRLLDGSHKKDIRRARAAAVNMIPTSSGAGNALAKVIPELKGKFTASAIRVPVTTGSMSDIAVVLPKETTVEAVNEAFKKEAAGRFKGVLEVTEDPVVSSDIVGTNASAIVDLSLTQVIDGTLLKVYAWYDNEWSYACRLVELAQHT